MRFTSFILAALTLVALALALPSPVQPKMGEVKPASKLSVLARYFGGGIGYGEGGSCE